MPKLVFMDVRIMGGFCFCSVFSLLSRYEMSTPRFSRRGEGRGDAQTFLYTSRALSSSQALCPAWPVIPGLAASGPSLWPGWTDEGAIVLRVTSSCSLQGERRPEIGCGRPPSKRPILPARPHSALCCTPAVGATVRSSTQCRARRGGLRPEHLAGFRTCSGSIWRRQQEMGAGGSWQPNPTPLTPRSPGET